VDLADGHSKIDMKRKWNWSLWVGLVVAVAGMFSYEFFAQFPATRDFPWANILLFAIGGILLVLGLVRAFGNPRVYRGKIVGPIFTILSLLVFSFFAYAVFYVVRQLPASTGAPRVGQKAPHFTLPDQNGKSVALADLLSNNSGALLIFYRGHW
jgi:peptidoglycan/LPS O-acetylase OafA/YrhL